jgi:peptidoglycan/LPS O-acetylase OafA/YrhL
MKRRIRRIANFFAFNLLFFALYLNFIHKDNAAATPVDQTIQASAAAGGTTLVNHPEKYLEPKSVVSTDMPSQQ